MNWQKVNKVHFIGIGGIGVSAVAKIYLAQNKSVTGSDLVFSEIIEKLEKQGAKIFKGHQSSHLSDDTELVVYSAAVSDNNPERRRAKELNIPQLSYPQFLGELSKDKFTIAVSGTNGKTTTTAMLGVILEQAGLDPTVIVGSLLGSDPAGRQQSAVSWQLPAGSDPSRNLNWQGNLRLGKSKYLVVEACEWRAHILEIKPRMIVLTNIENDHLDYYRDLNHILETFQKYIEGLSFEDKLILNADDPNSLKLKPDCQVITYGIENKAEVTQKDIEIKLTIPGIFNIYNGLAAASAALALGVDLAVIKKALAQFPGIWRRFEIIKADKYGYLCRFTPRITLINDYAHHPTAIRETIEAVKEFYPNRRIIAVFQPHQHNRTKNLFNDFLKSFDQADLIILSEIFDVAGREEKKDQDISSKDLAEAIEKLYGGSVLYGKNLEETEKLILENIQSNDIVLIMGAGDIYKIAEKLTKLIK